MVDGRWVTDSVESEGRAGGDSESRGSTGLRRVIAGNVGYQNIGELMRINISYYIKDIIEW